MHHCFQLLVLSHDALSSWISLLSLLSTPETMEECLEYAGHFKPYLEGPGMIKGFQAEHGHAQMCFLESSVCCYRE